MSAMVANGALAYRLRALSGCVVNARSDLRAAAARVRRLAPVDVPRSIIIAIRAG